MIAALIESLVDRSDDEVVEVTVTGPPTLPVEQAALDKLRVNEAKYPVEKSKGSDKKYTEH